MKIPPSFEYVYLREAETAERLEAYAGSRLRGLCADQKWLFASRMKSEESVFAKLQLGELASILKMDDVYAATVVVPTRNDIPTAISAVMAEYPDSEVKVRKREDPHRFQYDDTHIYATLGSTAPGIDNAIRYRPFEIQVRTGLQFSWWKATHDVLYKGDIKDWRLERVASQARGTLDLIDGVLADLPRASDLLEGAPGDEDSEFTRIVGWLDRWEKTRRPIDNRRFVDTVTGWLGDAAVGLAQIEGRLETERGAEIVSKEGLTPAQVVIALAAEEPGGIDALLQSGRRLIVTDELVKFNSSFAKVPAASRVAL